MCIRDSDMTSRRTAYFICDEFEDDVFIPTNNLNHALDKDKVKVYVYNLSLIHI